METTVCKSAEEIQDDVLTPKSETKGFLPSECVSLVASTPNIENKLYVTSIDENKQKINGLVNGDTNNPEVIQTPKNTEILSPKPLSPTLIEHALSVVKKLFSPEENKRKSTKVLNPISSQPNHTLMPCNSLCIPNKPDFSSEGQVEILENVAKGDHSSINQLGVMRTSLTIDSHNNTNDSFLTAVSLADDSFQSTVTHLDENGEILKCGEKIMENSLNDSCDISMSDSQDDMSPVSESYLENTMLKNGSFTTNVTKTNDNPNKSIEENLQEIRDLDTYTEILPKIQGANEVLTEISFENRSLKTNILSELLTENEKNLLDEKVEFPCNAEHATNHYSENNKASSLIEKDTEKENDKTSQTLKGEDLFLNKSCNNYLNSHKTSELLTEPNKNNGNSLNQSICELNKKTLEKREIEKEKSKEEKKNQKEVDAVSSIGEQEITLECSISTTTVILDEDDFADLDTMLMDLKKDEVEADLLSASYFEGSEIVALENFSENQSGLILKKSSNAKTHRKNDKGIIKSSSKLNDITLTEKKISKSERSSPNKLMDPARNKLNKSVDFIRETSLGKSPKGKKAFTEKSSSQSTTVISLNKNNETESILNIYLPKDDVELPKDELQITFSIDNKQSNKEESPLSENNNQLELNKSKVEVTQDEADAVSVVSQQSYTILTNTVNQNLKRPIINFLESDKNDLQENVEQNSNKISNTKFYKHTNGFLNEFSDNSSENSDIMETPKQSTPILSGCNELRVLEKVSSGSTQTFVKPTSINLLSDLEKLNNEEKVKNAEESENSHCYSKPDLLGKAMEIFSLNEEQISFSPVTPLNECHVFLTNSLEKELETDSNPALDNMEKDWAVSVTDFNEVDQQSNIKPKSFTSISTSEKSGKKWKSPKSVKGIETHGKKLRSPEPLDLNIESEKETESSSNIKFNQTFEKKPESSTISKLNEIFEENTGSPDLHPHQLNKTFDKISDTLTLNKLNQTYEKNSQSPHFNKVNLITDNNESCCELTQILKTDGLGIKHCSEMAGETNKTFEVINGMPLGKSKKFSTNLDKESGDIAVTSPDEKHLESHQVIPTQPFLTEDGESSFRSELTFLKGDADEIPQTADGINVKDSLNDILSSKASFSANDTVVLNQGQLLERDLAEGVVEKVENIKLKESIKKETEGEEWSDAYCALPVENLDVEESLKKQTVSDTIASPFKGNKLQFDPDLVQLIQQQFSCAEIEKICTVVDNLSSMNVSDQIMKSSEHFDKSCISNHLNAFVNPSRTENKSDKLFDSLTPQNLDFLNSIGGQPGGRDLSRVSLYVKFDPLVQSPSANSLIDFNKEVATPTIWNNLPSVNSSDEVSKKLLDISPQKKLNDGAFPPISVSNKIYDISKEDEMLIKNLQNEINFLKNAYSEKEQVSKVQLEVCENENCILKDKLKESFEKLREIDSLKIIIEECFKVISKLTTEFESLKSENAKQIEVLTSERDSYINHLQATEAAFIQVLSKYEKCKNTIIYLKKNEASYKDLIATLTQKLKDSKEKAKKAQEKAFEEFQNIQKELNETENSHNRELARIRAQLRKTELKLEDMQ